MFKKFIYRFYNERWEITKYIKDLQMTILFVDSLQLGPVKDGKQIVTLPDRKRNAMVQCEAEKEKVDEFLSKREKIDNKTLKNQSISIGAGTVAGTLIGLISKVNASKLEKSGFGALLGMTAGLFVALGCADYRNSKFAKLNDEFIAENSKN